MPSAAADIAACQYVCISGAGLKSLAFLGALHALERHFGAQTGVEWRAHLRDKVRGYAGASAGAAVALALCCGLSAAEAEEGLAPLLRDVRALVPSPDVGVLWERYGIERGEVLRGIVRYVLRRGGLSEETTFARMRALTRVHFCCSGTNLNVGTSHLFDADRTPHMRVADAVYISMCVPLLFAPGEHEGDLYVDGAMTCNLPVEAFPHAGDGEVFVWHMPPQTRTAIHRLPGFVFAMGNIGFAAQAERDARIVRTARAALRFPLSPPLRALAAMDLTMDAETVARLRASGYACALQALVPRLTEAVHALLAITAAWAQSEAGDAVPAPALGAPRERVVTRPGSRHPSLASVRDAPSPA